MFLVNWFHGMAHRAVARRAGISEQPRKLRIRRTLIRGSLFLFLAALTSAFVWLVPFGSAGDDQDHRGPQTYTVLVGAVDDSVGANAMAYFPGTLRIHVGDTVHWQRN